MSPPATATTAHEDVPETELSSVITCDLEGRIETFNKAAEQLFGYRADEVVGRKRVSLFSPGLVVLGHVGGWLAAANRDGEHVTQTAFVHKSGNLLAAEIRIRPTFKKVDGVKQQQGYCGITKPLDVDPLGLMPPISFGTRLLRWLVITRAPFLTATLVPVILGAAWLHATRQGVSFSWGLFAAVMVGALALHVAANTFNDYFDHQSGADPENNEYFQPFSGGSRSLELGLISERGLLRLGVGALLLALVAALPLLLVRGPGLLGFGIVGAFAALFYTAPPIRLVARKGLGELFVGLCFGPLMVAGTVYALSGKLGWVDFAAGLPIGLLTAAILWINQFPDAPSDARCGKNHLVVVLGKSRARWGYVALLLVAFGIVAALVVAGSFPPGAALALVVLPLGLWNIKVLFRHFEDRELVKACAGTIRLHLLAGLLMAAGLLCNGLLLGWLG